MALWAGIDEAGYGPLLGPLVVAGTAFHLPQKPREGCLWQLLSDAVTRKRGRADGRIVVDDSKVVYTPSRGIRPLEEGVLTFLHCIGDRPANAGDLLRCVLHPRSTLTDGSPWSEKVEAIPLPLASNPSALASKAAALGEAMRHAGVRFAGARLCVVLPNEFNTFVEHTGNKSYLLWQKCGLLLQRLWQTAAREEAFVLVDRHGGRLRYRKLLCDAFPECACDIEREGTDGSVYRISRSQRTMWVAFKEKAESRALPVALASMTAKYVREVYMHAFNEYWCAQLDGLKPTAGYALDGKRFLNDIAPLIERERLDTHALVRGR